MKRALLTALLLIAALPCYAAQIEVYKGKPELPVIGIYGDIEVADADQFQELSSTLNNAAVLLRSSGGKMIAGIRIGEIIKARGYTTVVKDYCASSCALIWLAGSKRFMTPTARIGLHQAYNVTGQADGMGNAVLGSYLTRLGLGYAAIAYATQTGPDGIKWLTLDDAKRVGIQVVVLGLGTPNQPAAPQTAVAPPSATKLQPGTPFPAGQQ
jgi:membrane-bound ClpP family serine protease